VHSEVNGSAKEKTKIETGLGERRRSYFARNRRRRRLPSACLKGARCCPSDDPDSLNHGAQAYYGQPRWLVRIIGPQLLTFLETPSLVGRLEEGRHARLLPRQGQFK
jgi:hypothetical protein